ncbi:MAG: 4-hydroxy-3-methylbut-2-enyl diphosphate reductase [Bacteroidota bacterium]|nr:4-hydroxy-3-methylbut-2-enyl diphosphate reductase [Bacteroidota bacterium]
MSNIKIQIDESSGFCWGVVRTIEKVEETLQNNPVENIFVLGDIIHNPREIERLAKKGLRTISHDDFEKISDLNPKVIIRAHGEPPSTYTKASDKNIELIDATCPLVTALQKRVKNYYDKGFQIIIYGKRNHAEVIGLRGVCNDECIVVSAPEEALELADFNKNTVLFSQTTMNKEKLYAIKEALESKVKNLAIEFDDRGDFIFRDTLCKYVYGREDSLKKFASENDIVIFVAGRNSSNGKYLYDVCRSVNSNTRFIEDASEIDFSWFDAIESAGITGATSTPQWYMELIKSELESKLNN